MAPEPLLSLREVRAGYGGAGDTLKGVSFDIQAGEIASIIGPNGAGKSTVFRVIYGFVLPRAGEITFAGETITNLPPLDRLARGIAYCPQGRCNFPLMTVMENLEMGAYRLGHGQSVRRRIEATLELFPLLARKRDSLAGNMSGGEQQILEMAMALLLQPRLLLLDEPSLGLSPKMLALVFSEVQKIRANGTTVILVEQNAKQSLQISDHAIVIRLGEVGLEGTGEAILADPNVRQLYLGG